MKKNQTVKINKKIDRAGLHSITEDVEEVLSKILMHSPSKSGILVLFNLHTSSALTLNESYDPSAKRDLERFLDHLAPTSLPFIEHTLEGPDDSPAHMKTSLLQSSITLIVEEGQILLGRWQGIYLAEFRARPTSRDIIIKFQPDPT